MPEQNLDVDLSLLERKWESGHIHAGFSLGLAHLRGKGVPQNIEKGLDYLRAAARKDYFRAALILSLAFGGQMNFPVKPKYALARFWNLRCRVILFSRAEKGDNWARTELKRHYQAIYKGKHPWLGKGIEDGDPRPRYFK